MSEFLLEILAEEIPAGVIGTARKDLLQGVAKGLAAERINGTFFTYSTSRRLVLVAKDLPEMQDDAVLDVVGPPLSAALDKEGNWTKAAEGFARSQGVDLGTLTVTTTPKGKYVVARKTIEGRPTTDILADILPPVIEKMTFPRMMRWGDGRYNWVRPVHSIVALFDGLVVPLTVFGVESSRTTMGHRTLSKARLIITGVEDYFAKLRLHHVEPDFIERRRVLQEKAESLAGEAGGVPAHAGGLVETWADLVEIPGLVCGSFDPAFLALPEEVLVTSMREHQKVLPVRSAEGTMAPFFLAVSDHTTDPKGLIVQGNEWVLEARFADAKFFFEEDLRKPLEDRLEFLSHLQFQEKLGDYRAKTERLENLSDILASQLGKEDQAVWALRAARLLKTDLVTSMVREFTDLQGVMGGIYARYQGETDEVWQAIYDQYLPASAEDELPRGDVGAITALADRIDTLTGLFGLGLVPTGSKDPYALRRAGLGVVRILLEKGWRLDLRRACEAAFALHGSLPREADEALSELYDFLIERLRFLLDKRGFKYDEIQAVLTTDCGDVTDALDRVTAVAAIRSQEDFVPLSLAFKRIQNILVQAGGEIPEEPVPGLMSEDAERQLASDFFQAKFMLDMLNEKRKYQEALRIMASLGPSLDRFFKEVMVMVDDEAVRNNRLSLLRAMRDNFSRVARFNEIQA
ncbi:MAG: glycine--tRNA ligase subunit beta [Acidobacteria bacterium]|nr:glycine--tRNA ligase subunit beta [Acidobacteriota bacterium]